MNLCKEVASPRGLSISPYRETPCHIRSRVGPTLPYLHTASPDASRLSLLAPRPPLHRMRPPCRRASAHQPPPPFLIRRDSSCPASHQTRRHLHHPGRRLHRRLAAPLPPLLIPWGYSPLPPVTGSAAIRPRPAGGTTAPPRLRRRPHRHHC
jgi:hypothetical protein